MSSNSVRISAALFEQAQRQGHLMCRSAAQQIEHWARLGAALEAEGASTASMAASSKERLKKGSRRRSPMRKWPRRRRCWLKRERQATV
jgi:hypothetical protein